jgi:peptidoglycan/xylan/chitin deacetylase (PgdA/CDA1 family)
MISFDVDGESPWILRDPALAERPLHMGMGAYGPKTGMPRILRVLDKYDIKCGFFIPGWIVERYPDMAREVLRRGHEIGHHGYLHEKPFFLSSREEEEALLVKTLDIFQNVLGIRPQGSRAPSCDPSKHTMELLRKHGFVYHSNLMDADLPYCHKTAYGELVELPTAWVNDDWCTSGSAPCHRWATASGARRTSSRSGKKSSRARTRRAASSTSWATRKSSAARRACGWSSA